MKIFSFKKPGGLKRSFSKEFLLVLVVAQFFIVLSISGYKAWQNTSEGCISCHANREKLAKLGYPEFYITPEMVARQSHHENVTCRDCHLGNGRAKNMKDAHKGMLKALFIGYDGKVLNRRDILPGALVPTGPFGIRDLLPKIKSPDGKFYVNPEVRNLLWQDRNPGTLDFDPEIVQKTCGQPSCHPEQLKQFETSDMGADYRQRTMRSWLYPYGPHNCGPSFADVPPQKRLRETGFDYANTLEAWTAITLRAQRRECTTSTRSPLPSPARVTEGGQVYATPAQCKAEGARRT